jgi:hypothetical protein
MRNPGRPKAPSPAVVVGTLAAVLGLLAACGSDKGEGPTGSLGTEWQQGGSQTYLVSGEPVADAITGSLFRFPEGGSGSLTVTRITEGPLTGPADSAFTVEYTGPGPVQLVMDDNPTSFNYLLGNVELDNACLEEEENRAWILIPEKETGGGELVFDLPSVNPPTGRPKTAWEGIAVYKKDKIPKNSDYNTFRDKIREKVKDVCREVVKVIPDARKERFIADVDRDAPPKLYVGDRIATSDKYVPFYDIFKLWPVRTIMHNRQSTAANVAHETGHYIHHVLVGDSRFAQIATNHRPNEHRIGTPGARTQLIEEMAYFTEYYITGTIKGNPAESGQFAINNGSTMLSPLTTDVPDLEGFGAAMFASVVRIKDRIMNYDSKWVAVPVVSPGTTDRTELIKGIYEIVAQGTDDLETARERVEAMLAKRGEADKLPAMLQPLGWSYHVKMKFVDTDRKPLANIAARSVIKAGPVEYVLPQGSPSQSDGHYSLKEYFGGETAFLRVYFDNHGKSDSLEVSGSPVRIPWSAKTNQEIDFGEIVVPDPPDPLIKPTEIKWQHQMTSDTRFCFTVTSAVRFVGMNAVDQNPSPWVLRLGVPAESEFAAMSHLITIPDTTEFSYELDLSAKPGKQSYTEQFSDLLYFEYTLVGEAKVMRNWPIWSAGTPSNHALTPFGERAS